ncbi:hypothetical protein CRM89_20665 [Nocardia sp. FDAARGOS_372]|nr:hypothetical protein CRM89_20665 [Nocardia sp. FDAARGOS_372]
MPRRTRIRALRACRRRPRYPRVRGAGCVLRRGRGPPPAHHGAPGIIEVMADKQPAGQDEPIPVDQTDHRSMTPFIAAAVIAVIVLVAIVLGGLLSPAEKNVTEADRITAAVQNFVEGTNATDEVPPPGAACADFDPARSPLAAQEGTGKTIELASVTDQSVNGNRAKATVTVRVDGAEQTATWNLVRADGTWVVCTA